MAKVRLDVFLVEKGLCPSREMAKKLINENKVTVNGCVRDKAGYNVSDTDTVEIIGDVLKYVSRGGLKLEKAVKSFSVDLLGKVCMDIGASTGGFTDCMLQSGAEKVFSVDVGCDQLAEKLRNDSRVVNMEKTNIRNVTKDDIKEEIDFISIDVAFISLKLVLPVAHALLKDGGSIVALIKPQFEAGRENVGKKGVVKDKKVHTAVVNSIVLFAIDMGFSVEGLEFSPIKGPEGNIEYLIYLKKKKGEIKSFSEMIKRLVDKSHEEAK